MKTNMHRNAGPGVFHYARIMRKNPTDAEEKLWLYLRNNQTGFKFRRQHPLYNYVVDFYCHSLRLAIEIDGGIHEDEEQKSKDLEKANEILNLGIYLIRFSNEQVMFDSDEVMNQILSTIHEIKFKPRF